MVFAVGHSMRHESFSTEGLTGHRRIVQTPRGKPRRVLPLAFGAVLMAICLTSLSSEAFHELSGDRYAAEILRGAVDG